MTVQSATALVIKVVQWAKKPKSIKRFQRGRLYPIPTHNPYEVLSTDSSADPGSPEFYAEAPVSPSLGFLCDEKVLNLERSSTFRMGLEL